MHAPQTISLIIDDVPVNRENNVFTPFNSIEETIEGMKIFRAEPSIRIAGTWLLKNLLEKRTAALLQRIPGMVEDEFQQGNIKAKKAIFTIGMAHIPKIIEYLNKGRIEIHSPLSISNRSQDDTAELNLRKANFNVYVIIPRTLADDPKVLEMNGLDKIVFSFRRQSFVNSSKALP